MPQQTDEGMGCSGYLKTLMGTGEKLKKVSGESINNIKWHYWK